MHPRFLTRPRQVEQYLRPRACIAMQGGLKTGAGLAHRSEEEVKMAAILGIDIAKDTVDICLLRAGQPPESGQITNHPTGFKQLGRLVKKRKVTTLHACMEATGQYGEALAQWLYEQGYAVSIVNPYRIHAYAKSQLRRNKTDKLDAALIADFCRTQAPPLWTPPTPGVAGPAGVGAPSGGLGGGSSAPAQPRAGGHAPAPGASQS